MLAKRMLEKMAKVFGFGSKSAFNKGELDNKMVKRLLAACRARDSSHLTQFMDEQDQIILRAVAEAGDAEKAKCALDRRSAIPKSEQYLLGEAARSGNCAVFRYILERNPTLLNWRDAGWRALNGSVEIWKVVLELDHNLVDWEFGHSGHIVAFAVEKDDLPLLKYLIKEGTDVEHSHMCYKPVLPYAKLIGARPEIIDLLVQHGATMKEDRFD